MIDAWLEPFVEYLPKIICPSCYEEAEITPHFEIYCEKCDKTYKPYQSDYEDLCPQN